MTPFEKSQNEKNDNVKSRRYLWSHEVIDEMKKNPRGDKVSPLLQEWLDMRGERVL
jgi:hypothetical protein